MNAGECNPLNKPQPRIKASDMSHLAHDTQKLLFENKLALLVFLAALVCLVVLPSYRFLALSAGDIAHDVSTSRHAALYSLALCNVDDVIEEVCFPVLSSKILNQCVSNGCILNETKNVDSYPTDDIIVVCQMGLAAFATEDLVGGQVDVV
jgi:hypothetical protein